MDILLSMIVQLVAGILVAATLAWLWPRLRPAWPGVPIIGGFGGIILGALRTHIFGGHHHMPGMVMPAGTDAISIAINAAAGAAGGGLLLLLTAIVCWLVPNA